MVMETKTQNAPAWDWIDSVGSKVRNAYDSFVVRAPKVTLLSTKTVRKNTSTSKPAAHTSQISVRESSPPMSFEPSAPSSCATARDQLTRDQLTNNNQRRLLSFRPLSPITEEDDPRKIQIRAAIVALRRAVSDMDQPQTRPGRDLRQIRESRLRRDQDAAIAHKRSRRLSSSSGSKAVERTFSFRISGDHFKRKEGASLVPHTCCSRRSSM